MDEIKTYMIDNVINNVNNNKFDIIKLISSNSLLLQNDTQTYNKLLDEMLKSKNVNLVYKFIDNFARNCTKVIYKLYQYK